MLRLVGILVTTLVIVILVEGEGDPQPEGRWRTNGHDYNLQEKLVFGQGGGKRRIVGNMRQKTRKFGEFKGGCTRLPRPPADSKLKCNPLSGCTATCKQGYTFSDGRTSINIVCQNGNWENSNGNSIEDCKVSAECIPACENGGICIRSGLCHCPDERFKGPQCQFDASVCDSSKLNFNGGYNCTGTSNSFTCSLICPDGAPFSFQPESSYTCLYSEGEFKPQPIPECVTGNGIIIKSHEQSYRSYSKIDLMSMEWYSICDGISSISQQWDMEIGSKWVMGQGLVSIEQFKKSSVLKHSSIFEYKKVVRASVMWMSFSEHIQFHDVNFQKLNALMSTDVNKPKGGSCFYWGGSHFKMFDGTTLSLSPGCGHVLVTEPRNNMIKISTRHSNCSSQSCQLSIHIEVESDEFIIDSFNGLPRVTLNQQTLVVPGFYDGMIFEVVGDWIFVEAQGLGVKLHWNSKDYLVVTMSSALWDKTVGLCGTLSGNPYDDYKTDEGDNIDSLPKFVESWTMNKQDCETSLPHPCKSSGSDLDQEATQFCKKMLYNEGLQSCYKALNPFAYYETCKWSYCQEFPNSKMAAEFACEAAESYVRACRDEGTVPGFWRREDFCSIECGAGMEYNRCGSGLSQQCGEESTPSRFCVEGCYCPEGTSLHDGECIPSTSCPCFYNGEEFPIGSETRQDCNNCKCVNSKWQCSKEVCGKTCSVVGDPHYTTFDGLHYDFRGQCSYILVKHEDFIIEAENIQCHYDLSQFDLERHYEINSPTTCTKTVTVRMNNSTLKLRPRKEIIFNGDEVQHLPKLLANQVEVMKASSLWVTAILPNGITIWWDGISRVYINVPGRFQNTFKGLCGTFSGNQYDDFLTPQNDVEENPTEFANHWRLDENCPKVKDHLNHPCDVNSKFRKEAEEKCSVVRGDLFKKCHPKVSPEQAYKDCLYDMCSCDGSHLRCLCPIIASYSDLCVDHGAVIDWRSQVRECGVHCPAGQVYRQCGDSCAHSCESLTISRNCTSKCVEGCNCPEGETLDQYGNCIPIEQCPCIKDGTFYEAESRTYDPESNAMCTCQNGKWDCHEASTDERTTAPVPLYCESERNRVLDNCPHEVMTCNNMHEERQPIETCNPKCVCAPGFVENEEGQCIPFKECPCHHGGKSYREHDVIKQRCNTCQCQGGDWTCTQKECPSVCAAWGEGHYKTFDGHMFDFIGNCEYILAKGHISETESFSVTVKNVPCGTSSVTCSKAANIKIGNGATAEIVDIVKGEEAVLGSNFKRITKRDIGMFVTFEVVDLGIVIQWDKGNRLYIRLQPNWKGHTSGLCGNFNLDSLDDFQTPSGILEASPELFGDSWKLHRYCPKATIIHDTCSIHPHRKQWSTKKCGILKSDVFKSCRAEVPLQPYFDQCVFDTCGCNVGGDCECLCTAVAAYAQACQEAGVPVSWRNQGMCAMQCGKGKSYTSCMSTCPMKTCDNLSKQKHQTQLCNDEPCVEGCSPDTCSKDSVYEDDVDFKCVHSFDCKSKCQMINGVQYYDDDLIEEDGCESCKCKNREKVCSNNCTSPQVERFVESSTRPGICNDDSSIKHPSDCSKYYECVHGTPSIRVCSPGTMFNHIQSVCDWPVNTYKVRPECLEGTKDETINNQVHTSTSEGAILYAPQPESDTYIKNTTVTSYVTSTPEGPISSVHATESDPYMMKSTADTSYLDLDLDLDTSYGTISPGDYTKDSLLVVPTSRSPLSLCNPESLHGILSSHPEAKFLASSSSASEGSHADLARLLDLSIFARNSFSNDIDAWIPARNDEDQFIEVNLIDEMPIYGLEMEGSYDLSSYTKAISVLFSSDAYVYHPIQDNHGSKYGEKMFSSNMDSENRVRIVFPAPVEAQFIRIIPKAWKNNIAIKFDVLGCSDTDESVSQSITKDRNQNALSVITNMVENLSEEHKENYGPTLSKLQLLLDPNNDKDSDINLNKASLKGQLNSMLNEGLISKEQLKDIRKTLALSSEESSPDVFSLLGTELALYNNLLKSDKDASEIHNLLNLQEIVIQEKLEDLMFQGLVSKHDADKIHKNLENSKQSFKKAQKQMTLKKIRDQLPTGQQNIASDLVKFEHLILEKKDIHQLLEQKEDIIDQLQKLKSEGEMSNEKMQDIVDKMNSMISEKVRDSSEEEVAAMKENLDTYTKEIVNQFLKTTDKILYTDKIHIGEKRKLIKEEQSLLLNKLDADLKQGKISVDQWINSKKQIMALTNNALVDVEFNNLGHLSQKLSKLKGLAFSSSMHLEDKISMIGEEKQKVLEEILQMNLNGEITQTEKENLIQGLNAISEVVTVQNNYNKLENIMDNIMENEELSFGKSAEIGSEISKYLQLLHSDEKSSSQKLLSQKTNILKKLKRLNGQDLMSNSDMEEIAQSLFSMTDDLSILTSDRNTGVSKNSFNNADKVRQVIQNQEENILMMKTDNLFSNTENLRHKSEVEEIKDDFRELILTNDKAGQLHKAQKIHKKLDRLVADGSLSHADREAIVDKISLEVFKNKEEQFIFDKLNQNIGSIVKFEQDDDEYMKIYNSLLALGPHLMTDDYENSKDSISHELFQMEMQGLISSNQSIEIKNVIENNISKQVNKRKEITKLNLPESIRNEFEIFEKLSKLEYSDDHLEFLSGKKNDLFQKLIQQKQIGKVSKESFDIMSGKLDSLISDYKSKKAKLDHLDEDLKKAFSDETLDFLIEEDLMLATALISTNDALKRDKLKKMLIDNIDKRTQELVSQGIITEQEKRKIRNERDTFLSQLKPISYTTKTYDKLANLIPTEAFDLLKYKLNQIDKENVNSMNLKELEVEQTLFNLLSQGEIDEDTYKKAKNIMTKEKVEESDIFTAIEDSLPIQFQPTMMSDIIKLEKEMSSDEINMDNLIKQKKKLSDNLSDILASGHINNVEYQKIINELNSDILKKVKPEKILDQLLIDAETFSLIQEDIENSSLLDENKRQAFKKKLSNLVNIGKLSHEDSEKLGLFMDLKASELKENKEKSVLKIDNDFNNFKGSLLKSLNIIGLSEGNVISPQLLKKAENLIYKATTKEEIEKAMEILSGMKDIISEKGKKLKREGLLEDKEFSVLTHVLASLSKTQDSLLSYSSLLPSISESTTMGYPAKYVPTEKSISTTQPLTTAKIFMYVKEGPPELALRKNCMGNMNLIELGAEQISTSSFDTIRSGGLKDIHLNSNYGWKPSSDSPNEFLMIDLLDKRFLSGIKTQGLNGDPFWVEAFQISYSNDGITWTTLQNNYGNTNRVFLGNFDSSTIKTQYFDNVIHAQYLKFQPIKWNNHIGLRLELIGCYKPYILKADKETKISTNIGEKEIKSDCTKCPGLDGFAYTNGSCHCGEGLAYDGRACVPLYLCPCYYGSRRVNKGQLFNNDLCEECFCLGGNKHDCIKRECTECGASQYSQFNENCECICKDCHFGKKICKSTNRCISIELWCDGIDHCGDDEKDCTIKMTTEKPLPDRYSFSGKLCPSPECLLGEKPVETEVETLDGCPYYKCLHIQNNAEPTCPTPSCPTGFVPKFIDNSRMKLIEAENNKHTRLRRYAILNDNLDCQRYECVPEESSEIPVDVEKICSYDGRTLTTFDNLIVSGDLCHHTLVALPSQQISVEYHKKCNSENICEGFVNFRDGGDSMTISESLKIDFNDNLYSSSQASRLSNDFKISQHGNTLQIIHSYMTVTIEKNGQVHISLPEGIKQVNENRRSINGLCGNNNNIRDDDRTDQFNQQLTSTRRFLDSWKLTGYGSCVSQVNDENLKKAKELCSLIRFPPFKNCMSVISQDSYTSDCIGRMKTCLSKGQDERQCKCQAMEEYVRKCLKQDSSLTFNGWRELHLCDASCPQGQVHHDCYQRSCEPTCENIKTSDKCLRRNSNVCFPGCYCPEGLVKNGNVCVKETKCQYCNCKIKGNKITTFDGLDIKLKGKKLIKLVNTDDLGVDLETSFCGNGSACLKSVTLNLGTHSVNIDINSYTQQTNFKVDGNYIDLPYSDPGFAVLTQQSLGSYYVQALQYDLSMKIEVFDSKIILGLPHTRYTGLINGLCGNCNSNKDDEFTIHQISTPYKTEDLLKFWSHDIERSPLENKNDPSSSYNPSQPFNGIDSLALINPSFLVKPHSFSTESSPSSSTVQSTVKNEGTYVDSLQQEENLYELPQERESSTILSTQSSFKTFDYNENEDLGYGIVPDERSTSIKPSQSSFKDQNYPEYNPENINAIILEDKSSTTNPTEANNSKTPVQKNTPVYGQEPERERISTSKPSDITLTDHLYPDYKQVDNNIHGEVPGRHTTARSTTQSSPKDDKEINYQESEGLPEEQSLQTSNNNAIESAADSTIARPASTTKYPPPSSLDYGYDPVPAALTCPQAHICNQLSTILKKCHNIIDPMEYIDECKSDICMHGEDSQETVCNNLQNYARDCREVDICEDWRQNISFECPAPKCQINSHYEECGLGCERTCQEAECDEPTKSGCFCNEGMVMINGSCQPQDKCHHCVDLNIDYPNQATWNRNQCTKCQCRDSQIHCVTETCETKTCSIGYKLLKEQNSGENQCCPTEYCVPVSENCEQVVKPSCGPYQKVSMVPGTESCPKFVCECVDCPPLNATGEILMEGEHYEEVNSGCCTIQKKKCVKEKCQPQEECSENLVKIPDPSTEDDCCPKFKCDIPRDKCLYTMKHGTENTVAKKVNETWNDGVCRRCKCYASKPTKDCPDKPPHASCSVQRCDNKELMKEQKRYVMEPVQNQGICCPDYKRVACKDGDSVYQVGQRWVTDNLCHSKTCVINNGEIETESQIKECSTQCQPGFEYQPSESECCGQCEPKWCVMEDGAKLIPGVTVPGDGCEEFECNIVNRIPTIKKLTTLCPSKYSGCKDNLNQTRNKGDVWNKDGCTKCHCSDEGTTVCTRRECQPIPQNCPLEAISTDESGCCQVCNLPENLETCSLSKQKTVSPLELEIPLKGHLGCRNSEVITDWGTCNGSCQSGYRYDSDTLQFKSDCHCCQASDYRRLYVHMTCTDGHSAETEILVPSGCGCLQCSTSFTPDKSVSKIDSLHHLVQGRLDNNAEVDSPVRNQEVNLHHDTRVSQHQQSNFAPERLQKRGMVSLEDIFGTQ